MTKTVLSVENLSKYYRLGQIGGGTLHEDLNRWWAKVRGRPDPLLKIGMEDHGNRKGGQIWALRDINLEVKEGEILGIIGGNGAGKSTLLKILSRITAPTAGRIRIQGRIGSLLEVGTGFHPELTGRENIYLNGTILGMSRVEVSSKLEEIVEFSEIAEFIDTPVKRYSSGMTVRLAFSVAAHLEPEILVIDEVLAVGDAVFQRKCLGKMKDVAGHGRTVLFVSHNMASINQLCSRAVCLAKGGLSADGVPVDIVRHYISSSGTSSMVGLRKNAQNCEMISKYGATSNLRIVGVSMENYVENNERIHTGGGMKVNIDYERLGPIVAPAFVISIKDVYGQELIRLSTMPISGYELGPLFGKGTVGLEIDRLPLVAGDYVLDVAFVREKVEFLIKLEGVIEFHVESYDVYGSGESLDRRKGIFVIDHEWSHMKLPS